MELSLALLEWMMAESGEAWLERAREVLDAGATTLQTLTMLRRDLDAPQATAAVDQVLLRRAAAEKFSRASAMWFTRRGLEQASSESVARYKASRFPAGELVADLCCGIGGDAIGLAQRGLCQVVDRDPLLVRIAAANCGAYAATNVVGDASDVTRLDPRQTPWVHLDPDRRKAGRRTIQLEFFDPGLPELERWSQGTRGLAVKIAPASAIPASWEARCERQWIGHRRECKQQVLWWGELARHPAERVAMVIGENDCVDEFRGRGSLTSHARTTKPGRFIVEPHPTVRAADLCQHLATAYALERLDHSRRFYSAEHPIPTGLVGNYESIAELPPRPKEVSAMLKKIDAAKPQIKAPGAPAALVQPLLSIPAGGTRNFVLILTEINDRWRCLLTQPVSDGWKRLRGEQPNSSL